MSRKAEHEPDERLADWVDGCMAPRDLDRFEAELRVNPRLRAEADEYRRTVEVVQQALRTGVGKVDIAERVLAAVQQPAAQSPTRRQFRPLPMFLSLAAAAALLMTAVLLMQWRPEAQLSQSAQQPPPPLPVTSRDEGLAKKAASGKDGDAETKSVPEAREEQKAAQLDAEKERAAQHQDPLDQDQSNLQVQKAAGEHQPTEKVMLELEQLVTELRRGSGESKDPLKSQVGEGEAGSGNEPASATNPAKDSRGLQSSLDAKKEAPTPTFDDARKGGRPDQGEDPTSVRFGAAGGRGAPAGAKGDSAAKSPRTEKAKELGAGTAWRAGAAPKAAQLGVAAVEPMVYAVVLTQRVAPATPPAAPIQQTVGSASARPDERAVYKELSEQLAAQLQLNPQDQTAFGVLASASPEGLSVQALLTPPMQLAYRAAKTDKLQDVDRAFFAQLDSGRGEQLRQILPQNEDQATVYVVEGPRLQVADLLKNVGTWSQQQHLEKDVVGLPEQTVAALAEWSGNQLANNGRVGDISQAERLQRQADLVEKARSAGTKPAEVPAQPPVGQTSSRGNAQPGVGLVELAKEHVRVLIVLRQAIGTAAPENKPAANQPAENKPK